MSEQVETECPACLQCGSALSNLSAKGRKRVYCTPECGHRYRRARPRGAPDRRRGPTTADVEYTDEEREVLREVERFRQRHGYRTLTVCEILRVLLAMGYGRAK